MSKRRSGFPSETQVKRGERVVHGDKVLEEKLGRNDLCPCGSGQRFKKCCRVDSEAALMEIYDKAFDAGLEVDLITDSGKTEFHGQPTRTCLAIGPADAQTIDAITGDLELL